jgi:hypothetical protein
VNNDRTFVSWMQNLHDAFRDNGFVPTDAQMDIIIQEAVRYGVDIEYNPGHGPNEAPWTIPHLHFGDSRAHVPLPAGFPVQPNYTNDINFPYGYP